MFSCRGIFLLPPAYAALRQNYNAALDSLRELIGAVISEKDQNELPHPNLIAGVQWLTTQRLPIDQCAISRVEILDPHLIATDMQARVVATDTDVGQEEVHVLATADDNLPIVEREQAVPHLLILHDQLGHDAVSLLHLVSGCDPRSTRRPQPR